MSTYRPDVDGLRAVAIVPVLLFHAQLEQFSGGFVGVDIFFVISGFLITGLILPEVKQNAFSIRRFYERRIRRIFPALFAVLSFCTLASVLILLPADLHGFGRSLIATTIFASNLIFYRDAGYFDSDALDKPLLHTWSLAVEEQYYIVFPLFLIVVQLLLRGRHSILVTAAVFASFVLSISGVSDDPEAAFYLAPTRAWELGIGALLAMGALGTPAAAAARNVAAIFGAGLIAYSVGAFTESTPFPGLAATVPCIGAGLIIWAGMAGDNVVGRLLSHRWLVHVGLISYSLYLWHWPLLVFTRYSLLRDLSKVEAIGVLVVATAAAELSWRHIERPFRGKNALLSGKSLVLASSASMLGLATCGALAVLTKGLPGRMDLASETLLAGANDRRPLDWQCANVSAEMAIAGQLCRIGSGQPGRPSFLIWGDSHGRVVSDAIGEVAARQGQTGLIAVRSACGPLVGIMRSADTTDRECSDFNNAVLSMVNADPSLTDVILVGRWGFYAEGSRYKQEPGDTVFLIDDTSGERSLARNRLLFRQSLQRTINLLQAGGKRIWVVAPIPEVGWNVPSVLARSHLQGRVVQIAPTLAEYHTRQKFVMQILGRQELNGNIRVLYPHRVLCSSGACVVEDAGRTLYFDEHHLTLTGARLISRIFEPVFAGAEPER